jgi:hypothetical protein
VCGQPWCRNGQACVEFCVRVVPPRVRTALVQNSSGKHRVLHQGRESYGLSCVNRTLLPDGSRKPESIP